MVQSLSTIERGTPPPRKKSCVACTKSKRRCNLSQPACQRCAQRRIRCHYPQQAPELSGGEISERSRLTKGHAGETNCSLKAKSTLQPQEPSFTTKTTPTIQTIKDNIGSDPASANADPTRLEPLDPNINHAGTTTDLCLSHQIPALHTSPNETWIINLPNMRPSDLHPVSYLSLVSRRFQYAIDVFNDSPRQMVLENRAPWCHHRLYQDHMPRVIQDAQAICAFYMAKSPANERTIRRAIESKVTDATATISSPAAQQPLELVARIQALILYQTMLFADDDSHAQAAAERIIPYLETAARNLQSCVKAAGPPAVQAKPSACPCPCPADGSRASRLRLRKFWESWVLQESAQRTALIALFVSGLYKRLCNLPAAYCDNEKFAGLYWTTSSRLWEARDEVGFSAAWGEERHFRVTIFETLGILGEIEAGDVDEFGRIILTTLLGIKETREWFSANGELL